MQNSRKTRRTLPYSHECHGLNLQCTPDFYLNVWFSNGDTALTGSRSFVERDKPRKEGWEADIYGLPNSCLLSIKLCVLPCLDLTFPVFPQVIYHPLLPLQDTFWLKEVLC